VVIDSRYTVLKELGSGNWAKVYKVLDKRTGKHCILKLFHQLEAKTFYEKFSPEEMHFITRLEHPNLVPVLTFGNQDEHIYFVRDYYTGISLENFDFRPNKINQLCDVIIQCLYALAALHAHKIYHLAIKPSNILFSEVRKSIRKSSSDKKQDFQDSIFDIEVKLIDYGFNKIDTDRNQQTISGNLPYIAPEILLNKGLFPQSDYYSLGVSLYKITTGTLPFSVTQISSTMNGYQHNYIPKFIRELNPDVPIFLDNLIMTLLEKNPEDRFPDIQTAIDYINKTQPKQYPYSQKFSLMQNVRFNSYIVRKDYAHELETYANLIRHKNGKLISLIGRNGLGKESLLTLFKYHFLTNEYYIFDYTCSESQRDPFFALIKEFNDSLLTEEKKNSFLENISKSFRNFLDEDLENKSNDINNINNQTFKNKINAICSNERESSENFAVDFESAKDFLSHLATEKPLIFIIREAHYIKKDTIDFINHIFSIILNKPILIIISANNPSKLKGLQHSIQIFIEPLTIEKTRDYVKNLVKTEPPEDFVQKMWYRSAGNPLFIRNILIYILEKKALLDNNLIDFDFDFDNLILPEKLHNQILSRLNDLEAKTWNHLKKLSIVHTSITMEFLKAYLNISGKELFDFLYETKNLGILREKNETYEFTFIECKQKLFDECTQKDKIKLSQEIIAYYNPKSSHSIEDNIGIVKNAELCKDFSSIRHYRMALVKLYSEKNDHINAFKEICSIIKLDLSIKHHITDNEIALDLLKFLEKADFTGKVKDALEIILTQKRRINIFEWHYVLANLYYHTDDSKNAIKHFETSMKLARTKHDLNRAFLGYAVVMTSRNDFDKAKSVFKKLKINELDTDLEALYYDRYGTFLIAQGFIDEAIVWYENSFNEMKKKHLNINPVIKGNLFNHLGTLYMKNKMYDDAQMQFINCKKEWESINYERLLGIIYNHIGDVFLRQGNTNEALEHFKKAETISQKVNNKRSLATAYKFFGETNIKIGKFVEAETNLLDAKRILSEILSIPSNINNNDISNPNIVSKELENNISSLKLISNSESNLKAIELKSIIENNLALIKQKIFNFHQLYTFLKAEHTYIFNNDFSCITPLIKSYIFFCFELGDRETLEAILRKNIDFTLTKDEDFHYQILAMVAIFKGDYSSAINNYKIALEHAEETKNIYSMSIIYIYLANCYCRINDIDNANWAIIKSEALINANNYFYWYILKEIVKLKIALQIKDIAIRTILREAFSLLPHIIDNHYYLHEIEIYGIIIQSYIEEKSINHAMKYHKKYSEKVREVVRYLPEKDINRFLILKKSSINNINDFYLNHIKPRNIIKSSEWNKEILSLLRIYDTTRIKDHLLNNIKRYFTPFSFAIILFNTHSIKQSLDSLNFNIYLQENFNIDLLNPISQILSKYKSNQTENIINNNITTDISVFMNQALEKKSNIYTIIDEKHTVVCPLILRHLNIGFLLIQDNKEMPFTKHEKKMLTDFSFHLSIMLIRISEFIEINEKVSLLKNFIDISSNINEIYDTQKLEENFVKSLIDLTKATRGFLMKKGDLGNYFHSVALDNAGHTIKKALNIASSIVRKVISTRQTIYLKNSFSDFNLKPDIVIDNNANSLYCAPIIIENEIYAILYLDNLGENYYNLVVHEEMMSMFITQANLAVKNARSYYTLIQKNKELTNLDTMKNDFIDIVSHEMNTPLITLQGNIEKMKKKIENIDLDSYELLKKADKSTKKLIGTIQDIITLNRYNSLEKLDKTKTNISELLESIYIETTLLSNFRKMKIKIEIEDNLPDIDIEWQAFHIMIFNIMVNAVRFTADYGHVKLGARRSLFPEEKIENIDSIVIYVEDNGIGIPENEQERIFKPFYELGDKYSHSSGFLEFRSGGLGLGLTISKRIADLLGAKIWVNNKLIIGSIFFISIPISQN